MSNFSINFSDEEQYKKFIQSIKDEVVQEIQPRTVYNPSWITVRQDMESRFRSDYNDNCGHWHNNQQSMYTIFRLAFQKRSIKDLDDVDGTKIKSLHDELFQLIDKYREGS